MKGHVTMGFFSRLMGGSDKQATATSEFEILAPVSGELVNLEKTNDPAFSSRAVGDGVAVVPQEGTVCAPVSGTVAALFPTEHALGIMSDDSSAQVMLHIGIDTVKLEGKGFHALVAQGDHVDAGQPLVEVDFDVVCAALDIDKKDVEYDYFGLNHFGWFTSIRHKGEEVLPQLREYIKEHEILLPDSYLKGMGSLMAKKPEEAVDEHPEQNRHTKGSWYYVWKGEYEIMECFPEYLPNTYLNYYLQQKEFVEHSNPERTRANEVEETREKNLFDGIDHYEKTGEIDESTFYAGSHGDWIADLAIALKNDTKQRFLVICENKGAIPNMPYDAMVELPAYIGKNGPEVISRDNIPLFQQGLMMQQLNSEKLIVEATIEGSYEKALKAFTLNKTVPSMKVAKEVLDDMIEANKGYWPELK